MGLLDRWARAGEVSILYQAPDGAPITWKRFPEDSLQVLLFLKTRPSVVRISVRHGLVGYVGTGFFVAPGLVATAWHVVSHQGSITVTTADGTTYSARVKRARTDLDVAVLALDSYAGSGTVLELAATCPSEGDFAVCIGHAEGRRQQVLSDGTFMRAVDNVREDWESEQVTAMFTYHDYTVVVRGGNSGGPVLDCDGRVLSIAVESLEIRDNAEGYWSQCIPILYLRQLLAEQEDQVRGYQPDAEAQPTSV